MAVSKEKVIEKLKSLKKDFSNEDVIKYFVDNNILPHDGDSNIIPKDRFDEVNNKKNELESEFNKKKEEHEKLLAEIETLKKPIDSDKDSSSELIKIANEEFEKKIKEIKDSIASKELNFKESTKNNAISGSVRDSLRIAGCTEKYLDKAVKMFDKDKFKFEFTDENNLEFEVKEDSDYLSSFKEDNDYWFKENAGDDKKLSSSWLPKAKPAKGETEDDLRKKKLFSLFPALKNTVEM